jgi:hypothetical protein
MSSSVNADAAASIPEPLPPPPGEAGAIPDPLPPPPGSTPVSVGTSDCPEKNIDHPKNDAATCWWLSANFALFHKKRRMINNFLDTKSNLANVYADVSKFYLGDNSFKEQVIDSRTNTTINDTFNKAGGLQISTGTYQDATEYILKFSSELNIPQYTFNVKDSSLPFLLYDIELHRLGKGFPLTITDSDGKKQTRNMLYRIPAGSDTFILYLNRNTGLGSTLEEAKMKILESVELPVGQSMKLCKFHLDCMVEYKPRHYQLYVKCSKTNEWMFYDALKEGKITNTLSFDELLKNYTDALTNNIILLFYSRDDEDSVLNAERKEDEDALSLIKIVAVEEINEKYKENAERKKFFNEELNKMTVDNIVDKTYEETLKNFRETL